MTSLVIHEQQDTKLPTMVVAFAGWPDAAEAATRAIRYMVRKLPGRRFAEIDPEEYYDFTIVRPQSRINGKGDRIIKWPCNEFYSYVPETNPQNGLLLYVGTEPNLKWKTYTETVMEVAKANGVELIVSLGALLDAVPHTRDVRVTGRASSEGLAKIDAELHAGTARFRPILMTTSTTVLGLLPMALGLGEGAEIRAPMAITVIGGLLVSTLLTLVLIPVVYTLFDHGQ